MTETQFQGRITDYCDYLNLKWHHEVDSRWSKSGWLDLCVAGRGGVLFAELKVGRNRPTKDQREWMDRLAEAGAEVHLWYPEDWDEIQKRLYTLAHP